MKKINLTAIAFLFGLFDAVKVAGFESYLPDFIQHLPLNEQNLAWLIPSLCVLVIVIVLDKVRK